MAWRSRRAWRSCRRSWFMELASSEVERWRPRRCRRRRPGPVGSRRRRRSRNRIFTRRDRTEPSATTRTCGVNRLVTKSGRTRDARWSLAGRSEDSPSIPPFPPPFPFPRQSWLPAILPGIPPFAHRSRPAAGMPQSRDVRSASRTGLASDLRRSPRTPAPDSR
jgi:hypothetical protein